MVLKRPFLSVLEIVRDRTKKICSLIMLEHWEISALVMSVQKIQEKLVVLLPGNPDSLFKISVLAILHWNSAEAVNCHGGETATTGAGARRRL
jgi:hypothetical protein